MNIHIDIVILELSTLGSIVNNFHVIRSYRVRNSESLSLTQLKISWSWFVNDTISTSLSQSFGIRYKSQDTIDEIYSATSRQCLRAFFSYAAIVREPEGLVRTAVWQNFKWAPVGFCHAYSLTYNSCYQVIIIVKNIIID